MQSYTLCFTLILAQPPEPLQTQPVAAAEPPNEVQETMTRLLESARKIQAEALARPPPPPWQTQTETRPTGPKKHPASKDWGK